VVVAHHRDCFFIRNVLDSYIRDSTLNAANCRRIPKGKQCLAKKAFERGEAETFRVAGKRDGGCPPSLLEWAKLNELLEGYASVELYLSPSDGGAGDDGGLARSDCIVSRLAEAGMVEHVPGIRTNLHLHATLRPHIERLAE
jgi:hypothetical protein